MTINGIHHRLGTDKKQAQQKFYELMADVPVLVSSDTSWGICDLFLEYVQKNRSPATYGWYRDRLQYFKDAIPNTTADALQPDRIQDWLDAQSWSPGYKRGIVTAELLSILVFYLSGLGGVGL